jgi:hypothetical protein
MQDDHEFQASLGCTERPWFKKQKEEEKKKKKEEGKRGLGAGGNRTSARRNLQLLASEDPGREGASFARLPAGP